MGNELSIDNNNYSDETIRKLRDFNDSLILRVLTCSDNGLEFECVSENARIEYCEYEVDEDHSLRKIRDELRRITFPYLKKEKMEEEDWEDIIILVDNVKKRIFTWKRTHYYETKCTTRNKELLENIIEMCRDHFFYKNPRKSKNLTYISDGSSDGSSDEQW